MAALLPVINKSEPSSEYWKAAELVAAIWSLLPVFELFSEKLKGNAMGFDL